MTWNKLSILGMAACLGSFAGCDDDNTVIPDAAVTLDAGADGPVTPKDTAGDTGGDVAVASLYTRLGGATGIDTVVKAFVGRVVADPKINGYFLNSSVNGTKLVRCLDLQLGNAVGGPEVYPSEGCRTMQASHMGMGVSKVDFDDLVGHMVATLTAAGVAPADIATIGGALTPMSADIVEDPANNKTVYQRLGRKPAIIAVIEKFVGRVASDVRINGFFSDATRIERLKTCLVRQVGGIQGPIKYGEEVDGAGAGVSSASKCRDMISSHTGLTNGAGKGISNSDFDALVEDLDKTFMTDFPTVTADDKEIIYAALRPMRPEIVAGPGKAWALTTLGTVVTFDLKTPGTLIGAPLPLIGPIGETILGIATRPAAGAADPALYALGGSSTLYTVNLTTGALTAVNAAPFTPALSGTTYGFDFNPLVDRIRVVSDTEKNFRLHPGTGAVAGSDMDLTPAGNVVAVSYTNSTVGAKATILYGIDSASDKLVRIGGPGGPNDGITAAVGDLGVDVSANVGFDIRPGQNTAYGVFETGGKSALYTVNLSTGAATKVGDIGGAAVVRALALPLNP